MCTTNTTTNTTATATAAATNRRRFQPVDASLFVDTPIYIWEVEDEQNFYGFPVQGKWPQGR